MNYLIVHSNVFCSHSTVYRHNVIMVRNFEKDQYLFSSVMYLLYFQFAHCLLLIKSVLFFVKVTTPYSFFY